MPIKFTWRSFGSAVWSAVKPVVKPVGLLVAGAVAQYFGAPKAVVDALSSVLQ